MYVLDETSWIAQQPGGYLARIEEILDNMVSLRESGRACVFCDELFHLHVFENQTLYDLFSADSPIPVPREVQERIASEFGRLQSWGDLDRPWPEELTVNLDGGPAIFAPSLAWAVKQAQQGVHEAVPVLISNEVWPVGPRVLESGGGGTDVWLVADVNDPGFYRWFAVQGTDTPAELDALLSLAFPHLDFVAGCTDGIKGMSLAYRDVIEPIIRALGVLSDHGPSIFAGSWQVAPAVFGSLGVEISDENGKTKANRAAEKDHTRTVGGKSVQFWWHIKLQPDRDRIHLDASPIHGGGKIIVGIFCRHLTV